MRFSHAATNFKPFWRPLVMAVGMAETKNYTYVAGYELEDGTVVHSYKHSDSGECLNLSEDGRAWKYCLSGYRVADKEACILAAAV